VKLHSLLQRVTACNAKNGRGTPTTVCFGAN
jgi:hypothetical protein